MTAEVNKLRLKPWKPETVKHGACMMQVDFLQQARVTSKLYVYAEKVYEIRPDRRLPHHYAQAGALELPLLRKALVDFGLPEHCRW
jgi:hypothetical protein